MAQSLEEYLQAFVDTVEIQGRSQFVLGDIASSAVASFGPDIVGKFAEVSNKSKRWIQIVRKVSEAFTQETRDAYPELTWQHFRFAATHTEKNPVEWLEIAQDQHLSTRDLAELLREQPVYRARGKCPDCETRVSVTSRQAGVRVLCPACPGEIIIGVTE